MLKVQAEITDMLVFGRNYCCSCRVLLGNPGSEIVSKFLKVYHWLPLVAIDWSQQPLIHQVSATVIILVVKGTCLCLIQNVWILLMDSVFQIAN